MNIHEIVGSGQGKNQLDFGTDRDSESCIRIIFLFCF